MHLTIDDNIQNKWYNLSDGETRFTYTVPNIFGMKKNDLYSVLLPEYGGNMSLERGMMMWKKFESELVRLGISYKEKERFLFKIIKTE